MNAYPAVGEEFWPGRTRCCEMDCGGSHYHCGRCGTVTSMMGHYVHVPTDNEANRSFLARHGLTPPFTGFTCDPNDERKPRAVSAAIAALPTTDDLPVLTVPKPTPDEDGVYRLGDDRIGVNQEVSVTPLVVATVGGGIEFLTPDEAEYRGAALIAAAQDVRRIAAEAAQEEP